MKLRLSMLGLALVLAACGDDDGGGPGPGPGGEDVDRAAAVSVKLAACSLISPPRFSVLLLPELRETDLDCVLAVDDCAAVLDCFGMVAGACPTEDACVDG